jgi:hypothetical protein
LRTEEFLTATTGSSFSPQHVMLSACPHLRGARAGALFHALTGRCDIEIVEDLAESLDNLLGLVRQ